MPTRFKAILLVAVIVLVNPGATRAAEAAKPKLPERLGEVLNWLPLDSETLIVTNGPISLPGELPEDRPYFESAKRLSLDLVLTVQDGFLRKQLQGQTVLIAVEASRRFTAPRDIGFLPYEGCQVLVFDTTAHDALDAAARACFAKAGKTVELGETKAAVFTAKWGRDDWTFFLALPRTGVLLCATNQKFLEEILNRMKQVNLARAFADDLPEWRHVDTRVPVWGLRHYRKEFAETDPTSPLGPRRTASVADSQAIGFVFRLDENPGKPAMARYLSGAKGAVRFVCEGWQHPLEDLRPRVEQVEPGVVQITAFVSDDDASGPMFLFVLLSYLGHAVYL